ncbi:MAG: flavin reductase family protein [Acidimicrobiales bacterium]
MATQGGAGEPGAEANSDVDDEYDRRRRRVLWTMPSGLYVIGSRAGDRRNAMTLNWATQVSSDPKLVAISVQKDALTHGLIAEGRVYSLCVIDRDDRAIVRKFTKPFDFDVTAGTLNGFAYHDGSNTGAPVLDQATAWLECRVQQAVDVGSHTLFLGEIVDAGFQKDADTAVLRMEDTRMNYGG